MIFDAPLRAGSLLQVRTAGHLHLFPAPNQRQDLQSALPVLKLNKSETNLQYRKTEHAQLE